MNYLITLILFTLQLNYQLKFNNCFSTNQIATSSSSIIHPRWLLVSNKESNKQLANDLKHVELETVPVTMNKETSSLNSLQRDYHESSSCQLVRVVHLLHQPGCQSKAIASFACSGSCPSYVQMSTSKFWQHERACSCCQQTGIQEATFTLDCPSLDPPYRKIITYAPIDCMCRACTDLDKVNLRPQELIEALSAEGQNQKT